MPKALAGLAALAAASAAPAQAPQPPKLVVVIAVDQLSADLFDEYRGQFRGGFARLASGTVFRNGYQAHAATETCPGTATILTGALPARSGIIANAWVDQSIARDDKAVYCAEDERVPGSTSSKYTVSSVHLKVPTLGDILKRRSPDSQNVAVAGKDRSAVMMSGHAADQRWYWTGKGFATDLATAPVPRSVPLVNSAIDKLVAAGEPPLVPPPYCQAKARPVALPNGRTVGAGRFARAPGDYGGFRASPSLDGATLALAAGLIQDQKLGRDQAPDILSIGLAGTDYVGHAFGTKGQEMCLQLLALDRELGDFFRALDRMGLDYAVALTSDHGGHDMPERLRQQGQSGAARIDSALLAGNLGKAIGQSIGVGGPVLLGGPAGDVYFDAGLTADQRRRAEAEALRLYRAHPQVEAVFTSADVERVPVPTGPPDRWTLEQRVRASFDSRRSGDLFVILKPQVTPIERPSGGLVATHGSPWDYDRRVPIALWGRGIAAANDDRPVGTVDIMPTLAAMIGVPVETGTIDGQCLRGVGGINCPAR